MRSSRTFGSSKTTIEDLVHRFQQGEGECALQLEEIFSPFLEKYQKLLRYGVFSSKNKEVSRFLYLFLSDEEDKRKVKYGRKGKHAQEKLSQAAQRLSGSLEGTDIEEEIRLIFYELLARYRPKKRVWFAGYLMGAFRYRLANHLKSIMNDPLQRSSELKLEEVPVYDEVWRIESDWVIQDNHILEGLTRLEKLILYERFVKGTPVNEISERTGYTRWSIWDKAKEAECKLRANIRDRLYNRQKGIRVVLK